MLKRILALAAVCLLLASCGKSESDEPTRTGAQPGPTPTLAPETRPTDPPATTQAPPPEIRPGIVGIYIPAADGTRDRVCIDQFTAKRTAKKDIDCFEVLASREARSGGGGYSAQWKTAWEAAGGGDAKVGFILRFDTADGQRIDRVIRKPSDAQDFYEYLEVYLYDDINQTPGVFYTHLSDGDMGEGTVISSIKLTSGSRISEVGDILLTVFLYTGEDCFDGEGRYIGDVTATVLVTEGGGN